MDFSSQRLIECITYQSISINIRFQQSLSTHLSILYKKSPLSLPKYILPPFEHYITQERLFHSIYRNWNVTRASYCIIFHWCIRSPVMYIGDFLVLYFCLPPFFICFNYNHTVTLISPGVCGRNSQSLSREYGAFAGNPGKLYDIAEGISSGILWYWWNRCRRLKQLLTFLFSLYADHFSEKRNSAINYRFKLNPICGLSK